MQAVQREIAEQLKVQPPFADQLALEAEVARRITFIQDCLVNARLKTLVLGISGGVDSLTAGLLAQRAMRELRERTGDANYKFIAVRLPYGVQFDEHDAQHQRLEPGIDQAVLDEGDPPGNFSLEGELIRKRRLDLELFSNLTLYGLHEFTPC